MSINVTEDNELTEEELADELGKSSLVKKLNQDTDRFFQYYMNLNPAEDLVRYTALRSESTANGIFLVNNQRFYDAVDEMEREDLTIGGALNQVSSHVERRDYFFEAQDDSVETSILRDIANRELGPWISQFLSMVVEPTMTHGFAMVETTWQRGKGTVTWKPKKLLHHHPGCFVFDFEGNGFLSQQSLTDLKPLGRYKWTKVERPGKYANPYGDSIVAKCWPQFFMKKTTLKDWAFFSNVYGTPIALAKINAPTDEYEKKRIELNTLMKSLTNEAGAILPQGVDIDFTNRSGSGSNSPHQDLYNVLDKALLIFIQGSALGTREAEFGSRAQADVHAEEADIKTKPMAKRAEKALNDGLVGDFLELNFGSAAREAVKVRIDTSDQERIDNILKRLKAALETARVPLERSEVYSLLDLKIPQEGDKIVEPRAPTEPGNPLEGLGFDEDPDDFQGENEEAEDGIDEKKKEPETFPVTEEAIRKTVIDVGETAKTELESEFGRQFMSFARSLEDNRNKAFDLDVPDDAVLPIEAAAVLGAFITSEELGDFLDGSIDEDEVAEFVEIPQSTLDRIDSRFRRSVEWMAERDILTRSQVEEMASALSIVSPSISPEQFENIVRERVFALKDAIDTTTTERLQSSISQALADGDSFQDWISRNQDLLESGNVPGGGSYLENVFRTESQNAYNRQRDELENSPIISDKLWGWKVLTANDGATRPGHLALHGEFVRKGSPEAEALGRPPWSYQCRCAFSPIIVEDIDNPGVEQSDDLATKVANVERF